MSVSESSTLKNCGFVKMTLMLLVILGHSCAFWSGNWFTKNPVIESKGLNLIYEWVSSFHTYAFTLVSGYIFAYKSAGGGYNSFPLFIQTKAKRLLIPYVFTMAIWVAPISYLFFKFDFTDLILKYILCINPSQLWFLWMLFDVFMIIWPIRKFVMEKPVYGWAFSVALFGIGIVGNVILPNIFCIWNACQYLIFFYIGMRIRGNQYKDMRKIIDIIPSYMWLFIDVIIFVFTSIVAMQQGFIWKVFRVLLQFVLHITGAIMAWTSLQSLAKYINSENRFTSKLTAYSMPMYLFHQQIIYLVVFLLNGKINPWINATINYFIAIVVSYTVSFILKQWKITRFLIGEK